MNVARVIVIISISTTLKVLWITTPRSMTHMSDYETFRDVTLIPPHIHVAMHQVVDTSDKLLPIPS